MEKCEYILRSGIQCTFKARKESKYCGHHDPAGAEKRKSISRVANQAKTSQKEGSSTESFDNERRVRELEKAVQGLLEKASSTAELAFLATVPRTVVPPPTVDVTCQTEVWSGCKDVGSQTETGLGCKDATCQTEAELAFLATVPRTVVPPPTVDVTCQTEDLRPVVEEMLARIKLIEESQVSMQSSPLIWRYPRSFSGTILGSPLSGSGSEGLAINVDSGLIPTGRERERTILTDDSMLNAVVQWVGSYSVVQWTALLVDYGVFWPAYTGRWAYRRTMRILG
jgi:hypothetical protein